MGRMETWSPKRECWFFGCNNRVSHSSCSKSGETVVAYSCKEHTKKIYEQYYKEEIYYWEAIKPPENPHRD